MLWLLYIASLLLVLANMSRIFVFLYGGKRNCEYQTWKWYNSLFIIIFCLSFILYTFLFPIFIQNIT